MPGRSAPKVSRRKSKGCTHHWVIELAVGATSKGRCKLCGRVKTFRNEAQAGKRGYQRRSQPQQ